VGGRLIGRRDIPERKVGLQIFQRLAVHFRIGINEIVERFALLLGGKMDVTPIGEEDTIDIMGSEEIVVLAGILPGF